jgi:hypothetical protein
MNCYVDSSALLSSILQGDEALNRARACERCVSSDLLRIECSRVLQRYRIAGYLDDEEFSRGLGLVDDFMNGIVIIPIVDEIKRRAAGPFPTAIGTLDAIHLATAILWHETEPDASLKILTYDKQLGTCAHAMGIRAL